MLMCTNKTCFAGVGTRPKTIFRIRISFLSYPCESKKIQNFLSTDQTSISGVNRVFPLLEWNFVFCFAIERSRSFKTVICRATSSSHCLSRDAENIRLTAFCWRCDKVEMRGTFLETEKLMQTKVVVYSWKLYYDTGDTFTRNRTKGFFDIRKEWKSFTIDIVSRSAQNTYLTVSPS